MQFQSTFNINLNLIRKQYNANEKPVSSDAIAERQRGEWNRIKKCDFCRPSENELAGSRKDFAPLMLRKIHGHILSKDEYVFTCSYRISQNFWVYEDARNKRFTLQYPFVEEIIRLAVFVRMEPMRCIILIMKLCFEKYWKRNYPLSDSFETVYDKFVSEFEQNNESILHASIFRDQKSRDNLNELRNLFLKYYPGTNFYSDLSIVLLKGQRLFKYSITDLSVSAFIDDLSKAEAYSTATNDEQNIVLEMFELVFTMLLALSRHFVEKEGPGDIAPLIEDIEMAREKLKRLYISCIQNKQKGTANDTDLIAHARSERAGKKQEASGVIEDHTIRLINISEKYYRLGQTLQENPFLVLQNKQF